MKFIVVCIFILFVGCASLPLSQAEAQTEKILNSDILTDNHIITITEKKDIKHALFANDIVLKQDQKEIKDLVKEIQSEKKWSRIGKYAFAIGLFIVSFLIIRSVFNMFRIFTKL